jgi:hypothetical protein
MRKIKKLTLFTLLLFGVGSCNSQNNSNKADLFKIENIEFSIPDKWFEGKNGENPDIGFKWTNIKSPKHFVFGIQHYNKKFEYDIDDLADNYLTNLKSKMSDYFLDTEILKNRKKITLTIMGNKVEGVEIEYKNKLLNVIIEQKTIFFQILTEETTNIFTATTNIKDWNKEKEDFELILNTLKVK